MRIVGLLALSLPLSAILAVRMPTVKANMNAAATAIMRHHGSPLGFLGHVACIAVYSTAACDGCHKFGEYRFGFDEAHFAPPVIDGAVQSGFSAFLFLAAAPQIGPEKN